MFGATMKIDYKNILGNTTTAKIYLDNSTTISSSGTCYNASVSSFVLFNLMLDDQTTNFTFTFNISGGAYDLVDIQVEYDPISKYFPNHENITGSKADIATGGISLFSTKTNRCYKCDASTDVSINGSATITFADMKLQPYGINNSTGAFSEVSTCAADSADMSMVIPIIVGAVLAGLIVIVIVAYVIGRNKANSENAYETI
jgi:lysosomal-associated membrane protein 1/2